MIFLLVSSADLAGLACPAVMAGMAGGMGPGLFYYLDYPGTIRELSGILPSQALMARLASLACLAGLAWLACLPGRLLMTYCIDFEHVPTLFIFLRVKTYGFNNCC